MAISCRPLNGVDCMNAAWVLQRAYTFDGTEMWANSEFFNTQEEATTYALFMKPFWTDMYRYRVIPTSELSLF
jgi:hypothetical protein